VEHDCRDVPLSLRVSTNATIVQRSSSSQALGVILEMLEEGHAWHYNQYDHNKRLNEAEQSARAVKKGLWSDELAVPPWEYRNERHKKAESQR